MLDRRKYIETIIDGAQTLRRKTIAISGFKNEITPSQWIVVGHVFRNEGATTNDVAKALTMSGSAVTQLVNGLVAKGYIKRKQDPTDKRAHKLMLSAASKKRVTDFKKKRVRLALKLFKALTDEEFLEYVALQKKLLHSTK